jgi:hypothetical protein
LFQKRYYFVQFKSKNGYFGFLWKIGELLENTSLEFPLSCFTLGKKQESQKIWEITQRSKAEDHCFPGLKNIVDSRKTGKWLHEFSEFLNF